MDPEQKVIRFGQKSLADFMRALAQENPYPAQTFQHLIWKEQCQLNIPTLIQASIYLDWFCKENGKKRILFTARDGCLWIKIFQKLFPSYESIYFHTSRMIYYFPTPSFVEYVKNVYSEDAVIVDSHGKGSSCEEFFRKHLNTLPTYLAIVNAGKKHHGIVRAEVVNEGIEKLNYDVVGTLFDVQNGLPIRAPVEYDLQLVLPSHACVGKALELLPQYTFGPFDKRIIRWMVNEMEKSDYIDHALNHFILQNEKKCVHHFRSGYLLVQELRDCNG